MLYTFSGGKKLLFYVVFLYWRNGKDMFFSYRLKVIMPFPDLFDSLYIFLLIILNQKTFVIWVHTCQNNFVY